MKLKNRHLRKATEFLLNEVSAKGKKNIHRMRIVKALQEQHKKYAEEELELVREYAELDEQGDLIPLQSGGFKLKGNKKDFKKLQKEFEKHQNELMDEYFVLDDINLQSSLKTVEKLVNEFDKELIGVSAEAHFYLVEAFEKQEEGDED